MLNIIRTQRRGNSLGPAKTSKTSKTNKTNILAVVKTWLAISLLVSVTACANDPNSKALQESLAADPKLTETPLPVPVPPPATAVETSTTAKLPADFPTEIPLYPNAQLVEVGAPTDAPSKNVRLRWESTDPVNSVQNFYQREFGRGNWQIVSRPTAEGQGSLVATRDKLRVTVSLSPTQKVGGSTEFAIDYTKDSPEIAASPQPNNSESSPSPTASPTPSNSEATTPTPSASPKSEKVSQLDTKIPQQLQQYVADLAQLEALKVRSKSGANLETGSTLPEPNKIITRREYARWLVAANNQIYASRQAKQIRLAVESSESAFSDIPKTDPDFSAIQGLAEAGLIPSSLSGETKDMKFRPDAPLTRETMILWKVPLDTRQVLPTANIEGVKEKWSFQDASKIDSQASRAVLADFNNGDLANIRRVFGFTTLFQPKKSVTRAEAAASLWYFGIQDQGLSAKDALQAKSQAAQ
ncbi:MAG: S-layer homology domain-containing protein [Microcoleus sp. PH2017_10_PVI_O_A]|uniref:S-layer homology domain-containing protein n=1 Tax=unclassified Microcoleus TaxID=2642155 RepID=UPI001E0C66A1|nr:MULTISPECIES: S-layer homology domain-containing protein [unclassified Microcoleus]TAE76919.1 MAG: S-layer homology domain-containing protein [Oscillatoriales cyanobacterium]MCC3405684.1 S-layer homology domain-containing protein [Microcoleus sp. PH2017_10_PVI_O_A]MCC3463392.1 S-layer homology domain-containing protein [Microcoleus sp. PH2017_11_PCY_U_A]MCC3478149.1 S-layer homology domain-containing protein [Microcoleus sp. PH2017_12_PCY_D_A]MCC3562692.1 S-layer homology domain-containing 